MRGDTLRAARLVRQVLGAISEFDKAMTVAKLRGARERKRREVGNVKAARTMPSCLRGWWWPEEIDHDAADDTLAVAVETAAANRGITVGEWKREA
jgi:hypothetical protein